MMQIELHTHEKMLLELLRAALSAQPVTSTLFENATEAEWKACYRLAGQQGVTATAWDGVLTLPKQQYPPLAVKLNWALTVERQEKVYERHCQTIIDLSKFYAAHGIATVQLKGVGFSIYYPNPKVREGGDIDIYTYSADPSKLSDAEASELADQLMRNMNKEVEFENKKHSEFTYKGVPIENHKTFLDIHEWKIARPVESALHHSLNPVKTYLLDSEDYILTPSDTFNTLFISFHAMRHYAAGLCLHHLCDWACLLNKCGLSLPKEVNDPRYLHVLHTFTAFTNRYLGTSVLVPYSETTLNNMMYEMFRSPYLKDIQAKNPLVILYKKTRRFIHYRLVIKRLVGVSIMQGLWISIKTHLRHPERILKRERK